MNKDARVTYSHRMYNTFFTLKCRAVDILGACAPPTNKFLALLYDFFCNIRLKHIIQCSHQKRYFRFSLHAMHTQHRIKPACDKPVWTNTKAELDLLLASNLSYYMG